MKRPRSIGRPRSERGLAQEERLIRKMNAMQSKPKAQTWIVIKGSPVGPVPEIIKVNESE